MLDHPVAQKAALVGVVFVGFFVAERVFRAAAPPVSRARLVRNGALWLSIMLLSPIIVAPLTGFGANHLLWTRPETAQTGWSGAGVFILDILLLDLWTYWLHRAYHETSLLWRFHEVHHRDEFLDSTSALRFHIGEVAISAALRIIPIAVLAIPLSTVIWFEALLLSAAIFAHSNVRLPARMERDLSKLLVTPSIHWVHHHAVRDDTDSNYAGIFSFWDPLFATRSPTKRRLNMEIGTEGARDPGVLRLFTMPFRGAKP